VEQTALKELDRSEWAATANAGALTSRARLSELGPETSDEAKQLAEQWMAELQACPPKELRRLMYGVRMMLDGPYVTSQLPAIRPYLATGLSRELEGRFLRTPSIG